MKITVEAPAPTGIEFKSYVTALENYIGETYAIPLAVDDIKIVRADAVRVLFDGKPSKTDEAKDIAATAREFAKPAAAEEYFA